MDIIFWLFESYPAPFWPLTIVGWLGWLVLLGVNIWLVWNGRHEQLPWNAQKLGIFVGLTLLVIAGNLFIGIRLPVGTALPLPNVPQELRGPALMLFSGLPLLLAAGILGPLAAAVLGLLAGAIRFLWDTHSIFTGPELALLAILFGLAVRQRYRTRIFTLLREPLVAALGLALLYVPLFIIDASLAASGSMAARLDYALTGVSYAALATGGELLLAGVFTQVLVFAFPDAWGRNLPLHPSPAERSLEARFLLGTGTLIISLLLALLAGDWLVSGAAARNMLNNRLKSTAELASQNIPFILETGQNLAIQISEHPEISSLAGSGLVNLLDEQIRTIPYFDQLFVVDSSKQVLGFYPPLPEGEPSLFPEEIDALALTFSGVRSQVYTIPGQPAHLSFIIAIPDPLSSQPPRALIARTDLLTNPFTQPLINSLQSVSALGGNGILLDENNRILYHPVSTQLAGLYSGQRQSQPAFFDDTAPNGTRSLVYYQPVAGRSWAVVLSVPAQQAQQLALTIAAPLSLMILVLAFVALISLRLGLKVITTSLQTLTNEAVRIAQGQLDHALTLEGVDEVGQLRRSFEQMRSSLQARLGELNRLLLVSQGVASSLDMREAVQSILEAVLATGASAVRVVMPSVGDYDEQGQVSVYALGPNKEQFAFLDERVMLLAHQQERVFIPNVGRSLGLEARGAKNIPASLLAIPLRHENSSYGVLWAGYDQMRAFSEQDIRFLTTLAGQAALAASNHHLFRTAEVGRQRLAAILASTPDPVLVIDQYNRLLLANPAAVDVLGAAMENASGQLIDKLVTQKPLLDILQSNSTEKLSAEIAMPSKKVYLAIASPVIAKDHPVGRVCILRDVTHFKELDSMKTEFVNTVSHDLRSPLTLIRGYATMLEMVGTINEQQQGYVSNIIAGVENMARLVNNLLDLGRVEAGIGLQLELVSLPDLLERVTRPLQLLAGQKRIKLTVSPPQESIPPIEADQALLHQALYNLVENAIKYTPNEGRVDVRVKVDGNKITFAVQDSGIGILPADQSHLFEKFYRAKQREAREQKGSGLGLAIVKSIAERHGGKAWVESQLRKGSTFFLQMPIRQP